MAYNFGGFYEKIISGLILILLVWLLVSCASMKPPTVSNPFRPLSSIQNATVIGTVQTKVETVYHLYPAALIQYVNEAAYIALLEAAKREYSGNIDIVDISYVYIKKENDMYQYSATGKVVTFGGSTATGVESALERAAEEVSEKFTARARLAIVYITAEGKSQTDFIAGELEHILRRRGFVIIDRSELDRIRAEQRFGTTGEVDDSTAARIGNIAGASVVITGRVDGEGNLRRLRLRALDTASGQVVGTASERLQ